METERRLDSQANLAAVDAGDRDSDVTVDQDRFAGLASQDEHVKTPSRLVSVATPLAGMY